MKGRERIIIILAVIAVGYWLYDSFFTAGESPLTADSSLADSLALASSLKMEMDQGALDPPSGLPDVMEKINYQWQENAFVSRKNLAMLSRRDRETIGEQGPEIDPDHFVYSGFLDSDNRQVGIINGLDYLQGDIIDGLLVERITAHAVHLRQGDRTVAIPLLEE